MQLIGPLAGITETRGPACDSRAGAQRSNQLSYRNRDNSHSSSNHKFMYINTEVINI